MTKAIESKPYPVIYLLDSDDRIAGVNTAWDQFARANGGETLLSPTIIGQTLFSHIADEITAMYLKTLFGYVRTMQRPLQRDYRCDSDAEKRYMQMHISPLPESGLKLEHLLIRSEILSPTATFECARAPHQSATARCSLCNAVFVDNSWEKPDCARSEGSIGAVTVVIYTVCSRCQHQPFTWT